MQYFCCSERRRDVIRGNTRFNGIDYLEVLDDASVPSADRQRVLMLHLINPVQGTLTSANMGIDGGERVRNIQVLRVDSTMQPEVLSVRVNMPGDFSIYTLRLVLDADHTQPPPGYDAILSSVEFSFKIECSNDFDCQDSSACPPRQDNAPVINYLARDYSSYRRVMLDRLSLLIPQWQERHPADAGIALVELLAYTADYLSYQQDVIATEAYIGTARRRISVRRHARFVDYAIQEGSNARAWLHFTVNSDTVLPEHTQVLTRITSQAQQTLLHPGSHEYQQALQLGVEVFETMEETQLYNAHNTLSFYTWGEQDCCLSAGATSATLLGTLPDLQVNDVLIFQERLGPHAGAPGDADPSHRYAVRLTEVTASSDPIGGLFLSPPLDLPVAVTEIAWDPADALPFPLCLTSHSDEEHGSQLLTDVSVALGNIALADHGRSVSEPLGYVPAPTLARVQPGSDPCQPSTQVWDAPRFRPRLSNGPLTQVGQVTKLITSSGVVGGAARQISQSVPFDPQAPAQSAMQWDPSSAVPSINVTDSDGQSWSVQPDLLNSDAFAHDFVAEIDDEGLAVLRFGDDVYGMRPKPSTNAQPLPWQASYRIGNGIAGNVGAETLAHIVSYDSALVSVTNPLAAQGGIEAESLEHVRQNAPVAFRIQERAVTLDDYASVAMRHAGIQRAVASFVWTGSWRTVFLTIERTGGLEVDDAFKSEMRQFMERYRMAGQDIEISAPHYVALEITIGVCLKPGYFWSDVETALLATFGTGILPDGRRGLFYPDNFTFGQSVYLSQLYAAAQDTPGVALVEIPVFQRFGLPNTNAVNSGHLDMERLEIARLENDPNFPERGVLHLEQL